MNGILFVSYRLVMDKYVVLGCEENVLVFNMVDGGPPVRHPFSSGTERTDEGVEIASGLLCDEYQMFAFGSFRPFLKNHLTMQEVMLLVHQQPMPVLVVVDFLSHVNPKTADDLKRSLPEPKKKRCLDGNVCCNFL